MTPTDRSQGVPKIRPHPLPSARKRREKAVFKLRLIHQLHLGVITPWALGTDPSSSFIDISTGTSSARHLSRPFRCSAACRVCETILTTSGFWLEEQALLLSNFPLQVASLEHGSISPPTAHLTQTSLCEPSSSWQNFQLALHEFFWLQKKEQIPSFYPCIIWKMSNSHSLRIYTREDFIKLKWEEGRTHQFVPKTYHGFWLDVVKCC